MLSAENRPFRRSFNCRRPDRLFSVVQGYQGYGLVSAPLHRLRVPDWRSASVLLASMSVVPLLQKAPRVVKNRLEGSNRPQITFPHMHSMTGSPWSSRMILPERSRAQSFVSGKPRTAAGNRGFQSTESPRLRAAVCRPPRSRIAAAGRQSPLAARSWFPAPIHHGEKIDGDLPLLFRLLALGDVLHDGQKTDEIAGAISQRCVCPLAEDGGSVLGQVLILTVGCHVALSQAPHDAFDMRAYVSGTITVACWPRNSSPRTPKYVPRPGLVIEAVVSIKDNAADRHPVHLHAQPFLICAQGHFHSPAHEQFFL